MKKRSLAADSLVITTGQAMFEIDRSLTQQAYPPESNRLEYFDTKSRTWVSYTGTLREVKLLQLLYQLNGPSIPMNIYKLIPFGFDQLRNGMSNEISRHEGRVLALEIAGIEIPVECFTKRRFNAWLWTFELGHLALKPWPDQ